MTITINSVNGYELARVCAGTLCGADLRGVDLCGANLTGMDLTGANLFGIRFERASLRNTILRDAHLEGADLRYADLTAAYLDGAIVENGFKISNRRGGNVFNGSAGYHQWIAYNTTKGILLRFGCECHLLKDWKHALLAKRHEAHGWEKYASVTKSIANLAKAHFSI